MSVWIQAFRLRTLFLSLSCIAAGITAASLTHSVQTLTAVFTVLTALFLQILSNLANDYGDSIHGADNAARKGPSRTVQTGAIPRETMKKAVILFSVLSLVSGMALLFCAYPVIGLNGLITLFVLGLGGIASAIFYTNGKRPYGYAGLGDISVLIFFGFVAVMGSAYLQEGMLVENLWLPGLAFGCFSVGVLNVNNMRDIESDPLAGKKSIPVRLGSTNAKHYHAALILSGLICFNFYASHAGLNLLFFLPADLLLLYHIAKIYRVKKPEDFDPYLKQLSLSTFLLSLLFIGSTFFQ